MAPETPKGVSSRLLTMKFMQRAAAAAASASASGSADSGAPLSKKRKLDQSPAPGRIDPNIDQALIQAALDDQEAIRQAALEKHTVADTHWVLKSNLLEPQSRKQLRPVNIVYVGYGDLDSDMNEDIAAGGRTSTKPSKQMSEGREASDSHEESSSSSERQDDDVATRKRKKNLLDTKFKATSTSHRPASQSQSWKDPESARAKEFRDRRKKKVVRLNNLTSISSAGDGQVATQDFPNGKALTCYNCRQTGHKASDCPNGSRK